MTQWRDARLARALAHAPDAQQTPAPATRASILLQARQALAEPAAPPRRMAPGPAPWWARWFAGGPRRPWNAAFASVLLAGVVTSLWWQQEVPGPAPAPGTRATESAAPPPAAPAPQDAAVPAPAPPGPATAARASPPRRPAAPAPPVAAVPAPAPPGPATAERASPPRDRAAAVRQDEDQAPRQGEALARKPVAPPATPAPPAPAQEQREQAADEAKAMQDARGAASPPAPAPAPAPAPPAPAPAAELSAPAPPSRTLPSAQAGAAPMARLRSEVPGAPGWTAWRTVSAAGSAMARDALAPELARALDALLRAGSGAVTDQDAPPLLSVELLRGEVVLGRLDLGAQSLRWTPAGGAAPASFHAPLEPALSERLRAALAR